MICFRPGSLISTYDKNIMDRINMGRPQDLDYFENGIYFKYTSLYCPPEKKQ